MGGHRTLGEAGRAAGVEDAGQLVGAWSSTTTGSPSGSGSPGGTRGRAGVLDDVGDLGLGEAGVDRDDDPAGEQGAEEGRAPTPVPLARQDGDPVAPTDTGCPEATGRPRAARSHSCR